MITYRNGGYGSSMVVCVPTPRLSDLESVTQATATKDVCGCGLAASFQELYVGVSKIFGSYGLGSYGLGPLHQGSWMFGKLPDSCSSMVGGMSCVLSFRELAANVVFERSQDEICRTSQGDSFEWSRVYRPHSCNSLGAWAVIRLWGQLSQQYPIEVPVPLSSTGMGSRIP